MTDIYMCVCVCIIHTTTIHNTHIYIIPFISTNPQQYYFILFFWFDLYDHKKKKIVVVVHNYICLT